MKHSASEFWAITRRRIYEESDFDWYDGGRKDDRGRLLAQTGAGCCGQDTVIEQQDGRPIPRIFAEQGEAFFRDLETAVAKQLAQQSDLVIATGGGVVLRQENMQALRQSGLVIFLNRPADAHF